MKLNLNFNGLTKLRDWWNVVLSNFKIIEKECTKTREIADNACTKEEARSYINEFIGTSDEHMAAIEAFTELYEKNGNSVSAMDEVFGGRLKYYSKEEAFDVNDAVGEDAIYFCKAETINTPDCGKGVLISSADGCQSWINKKGLLCTRRFSDDIWSEWTSSNADVLEILDEQSEKIEKLEITKSRVQIGSYVGTGTYGADNPTLIHLNDKPKVVIMTNYLNTNGDINQIGEIIHMDFVPTSRVRTREGNAITSGTQYTTINFNDEENILSFMNEKYASVQYNTADVVYYYVAIF